MFRLFVPDGMIFDVLINFCSIISHNIGQQGGWMGMERVGSPRVDLRERGHGGERRLPARSNFPRGSSLDIARLLGKLVPRTVRDDRYRL